MYLQSWIKAYDDFLTHAGLLVLLLAFICNFIHLFILANNTFADLLLFISSAIYKCALMEFDCKLWFILTIEYDFVDIARNFISLDVDILL